MTDYMYAYNEGYRDGTKAEREKNKATIENLQFKIDCLMCEYCPDEITKLQWANFKAHQKPYKG